MIIEARFALLPVPYYLSYMTPIEVTLAADSTKRLVNADQLALVIPETDSTKCKLQFINGDVLEIEQTFEVVTNIINVRR